MNTVDLRAKRSSLEAEVARLRGQLEEAEWALGRAQARSSGLRGFWIGIFAGGGLVLVGFGWMAYAFFSFMSHMG